MYVGQYNGFGVSYFSLEEEFVRAFLVIPGRVSPYGKGCGNSTGVVFMIRCFADFTVASACPFERGLYGDDVS